MKKKYGKRFLHILLAAIIALPVLAVNPYGAEANQSASRARHFMVTTAVDKNHMGGSVRRGVVAAENTSVTVVATPYNGFAFSGWYENGVRVSRSAFYNFPLTENRMLQARFEPAGPDAGHNTVRVAAGSRDEMPYIFTWNAWSHPAFGQSNWFLESLDTFKREVVYVFDFPNDTTEAAVEMTINHSGGIVLEASTDLKNWNVLAAHGTMFHLSEYLEDNATNTVFVRVSDIGGWIGLLSWTLRYNSDAAMGNLNRAGTSWLGSRANTPNLAEAADERNYVALNTNDNAFIHANGGSPDSESGGQTGFWLIPGGRSVTYAYTLTAGSRDIWLYANMANRFKVEYAQSPNGPWRQADGAVGDRSDFSNNGSYFYNLDVSAFSSRNNETTLYIRFTGDGAPMTLRSWGVYNVTGGFIVGRDRR